MCLVVCPRPPWVLVIVVVVFEVVVVIVIMVMAVAEVVGVMVPWWANEVNTCAQKLY